MHTEVTVPARSGAARAGSARSWVWQATQQVQFEIKCSYFTPDMLEQLLYPVPPGPGPVPPGPVPPSMT